MMKKKSAYNYLRVIIGAVSALMLGQNAFAGSTKYARSKDIHDFFQNLLEAIYFTNQFHDDQQT